LGSVEVNSKVMGKWHHPEMGVDSQGRATFKAREDYNVLLENENFKLWYDGYQGKSSKRIALLTIWRILERGRLKGPDDFLKLEPVEAKRIIRLVVNGLETDGYTQAARQTLIFARQFYNYHNEDLGKYMKFKRNERPKTTMKKITMEIIPDRLEVYKMASAAFGLAYHGQKRNRFIG